jgi:hypothetical protein
MERARVFRRSLGFRLLSIGCAALFVGGAFSFLLESGLTAGGLVLAALALLSLINLIGAYADRYVLGESGIVYENALSRLVGMGPRRLAWDDVVRVREHRRLHLGRSESDPSVLFLFPRTGRRLVLDSLEEFDEVLRTVRRRCRSEPARDEDPGGC